MDREPGFSVSKVDGQTERTAVAGLRSVRWGT